MNENKTVKKVTAVGISGNTLLAAFKLFAGIAGKSEAMISDAIHSAADVFVTVVAFAGVRLSKKAPDSSHRYGHERVETLASLLLGLILLATGVLIGISGVKNIIEYKTVTHEPPGVIALVAALLSVIIKEGMFWYTSYFAKKLNSDAFKADAWHHRSDALSSVGSLVGIAMSKLGFPFMDSVASVIICLFIGKVGFDIIKSAVSNMLDTSCGEEWENEMSGFILSQNGVKNVDMLKSRKFGNRVYVDVEISVEGEQSLKDAHEIAENVHNAVELKCADIKNIMIHENPI